MEKKRVRALATAVFGILLAMSVLRGHYTEDSEMAEIQDAMRNLRRADNLQIASGYTYLKNGVEEQDRVDVWADMLTGEWVSESSATDEDGTRLYLKQFCDGQRLYNYAEWSGEWIQQVGGSVDAPNLESVTVLTYHEDDVCDAVTVEEDGYRKISYTFAPEYLQREHEKRLAEMEKTYAGYEGIGAGEKALRNMEYTVLQYEKSRYEDITVKYAIDENQTLRGLKCTATWVRPALLHTEDGEVYLGEEEKVELELIVEVVRYNQDGTLNKIAQCKNELGY